MLWTVAKEAAGKWSSHKDARQGAALAHDPLFDLTKPPRHPPCQVQCTDEGQMRD